MASTKIESRYTSGPKVAAELIGAAKTGITGKRSSWLSEANRVETLLKHLQSTIGEPPLPEVGNFMRQYFKTLKRQRGESMTAFCVGHREEYEKMCRSLARMCKDENKGVTTSTMPRSSMSADNSSMGEAEGHEGREDSKETSERPYGNSEWQGYYYYNSWWYPYHWGNKDSLARRCSQEKGW